MNKATNIRLHNFTLDKWHLSRLVVCLMLMVSWSFAQTLSYQEAIELIPKSPAMQLAQTQLELAERQAAVASSPLQLNLSAGYTQTWGRLEAPGLAEARDLSGGDIDPISLSATLNVVPYGPRNDQVLRNQWAVERALRSLQDAYADAVITVTQQFQAAILVEKQLVLERFSLELSRMQLAEVQARLVAGAATSTQLMQAELAVQQAEQSLARTEHSREQSLLTLSISLGRRVEALSGTMPSSQYLEFDLEAALTRRSDVLNAHLAVQDAELTRQSILRENLPGASLNMRFGQTAEVGQFSLATRLDSRNPQPNLALTYDPDFEAPGALPEQRAQTFSLGVSATIPLDVAIGDAFAAGELAVEQSRLQAERVRELAKLDIQAKEFEVLSVEASAQLAQSRYRAASETLRTTEARLSLGLVSELAVKQAELERLQAELALIQTEHNLRLAHMRLALALARHPLEVF